MVFMGNDTLFVAKIDVFGSFVEDCTNAIIPVLALYRKDTHEKITFITIEHKESEKFADLRARKSKSAPAKIEYPPTRISEARGETYTRLRAGHVNRVNEELKRLPGI